MSLGDLAINAPISYCQNYLNESLQILGAASDLTLKRAEYKEDADVLDYLTDLRTSVLTSYSTLA